MLIHHRVAVDKPTEPEAAKPHIEPKIIVKDSRKKEEVKALKKLETLRKEFSSLTITSVVRGNHLSYRR
jgi:hypothetical protein